jgi:DNA-directed RNA polymerase II subunit RPB2
MDIARNVFELFFKDIPNPLVRHHLDSFKDFVDNKIPRFIKASNPIKLLLDDGRRIEVYVGGKDGNKFKYVIPQDDENNIIFPHSCRLENKTYKFDILTDFYVEYIYENEKDIKIFEDIKLASIPLMLKSSLCYLSTMNSEMLDSVHECKSELGGYFIIDGQERVLLTQESLGANMFHAKKRKIIKADKIARTITEYESESKIEGSSKGEEYEYVAGISSTSEDGTKGPYSHLIIIPPKQRIPNIASDIQKINDWSSFYTKRLASIKLPGFLQPVPLLSVFKALGISNDKDLYDIILFGIPESERSQYDTTILTLILSHETYLKQVTEKENIENDTDLFVLVKETRSKSQASVYNNLLEKLFPHCEMFDDSVSTYYRRKAFLLGYMTRMALDIDLELAENSDRDHFKFKRLSASGELCFEEFRRIYNEVKSNFKTSMDSRVEFEKENYKGRKLSELLQEDTLRQKYWKTDDFLTGFTKSFKGVWGGSDGVSQVLSRYSYVGTIAHLRRVNLMMDKDTKSLEARRLHSSTWGFLCPVDNPDGGNIGMIKSLSLLSRISTQTDSQKIRDLISSDKEFISINVLNLINNPKFTKIYLNSDFIGLYKGNTEIFHEKLLLERRSGKIDVFISLFWNRSLNEYIIFSDSGRICRPLYKENVKPLNIKDVNSWNNLLKYLEFIDPQETEGLLISREPFTNYHSEIHGTAILSPSALINPFVDHNQGPRNMFSCQQVKQACSWYNTAFSKRFDTISTLLHTPQRPLCETWTSPYILGGNNCMPYGENTIVAISIYSGYNQDDSIIVNESALKRGMFQTSYYHSYDFQEESLNKHFKDGIIQVINSTQICNPALDPKFREIVKLNPKYDYSLLDSEGVIRIGSHVTPETTLVGIVTPQMNYKGEVKGFIDTSKTPKRGQHGIIDGIYRYTTSEGLQGIKIRISETRLPILGDKFSARHGQKGTCGIRMKEEDMPFTAEGLRPDLIINPCAFPSRMTIGQFVESMSNILAVDLGVLIDSTAFSTQNRIQDTKEILLQLGYNPYGNQLLYNGQTGELIQSEIFMGPTYYLRSKLMTEDKINYRSTGPVTKLTRQPLEGRAQDGGLRIGEMERDGLLSHGIMGFLTESMTKRSDGGQFLFQKDLGRFDTIGDYETKILSLPYSMRLFIQELEASHIEVKLLN